MSEPFRGVVNLDIRESVPDWSPWAFTGGTLHRVAIDVSGEPYLNLEREAAAMLARE
jgi:arylsulfatase